MDDLWFYDLNAHRWVCCYPGYDTKNPPEHVVNADGFEATKDGEPIPIVAAVHEYGMSTYDPDAGKFACLPAGGDFGIVHVNFENQKRTPKDSAHFYSKVIATNGLVLNEPAHATP